VRAGAIGYYISAILINSILYVIYIELIYISFWLIIMNCGREKIKKEEKGNE